MTIRDSDEAVEIIMIKFKTFFEIKVDISNERFPETIAKKK